MELLIQKKFRLTVRCSASRKLLRALLSLLVRSSTESRSPQAKSPIRACALRRGCSFFAQQQSWIEHLFEKRRNILLRECPAVLFLQRRRMFPLVCAIGMPGTGPRCQIRDAGRFVPAVSAGVLRLFRSFIRCMLSFVRTIGMPGADSRCQIRDAGKFLPAVLAIIPLHFYSFAHS